MNFAPNSLILVGIFSCDACDQWCQRDIICGRRITKPRSEMKLYPCSRSTKCLGPTRIRVVFNGDGIESSPLISEKADNKVTLFPVEKKSRRGPIPKALKPIIFVSPTPSCATALCKSETAADVEMQLKLKQTVSVLEEEMKKKDQKFRDFQKKMQPFTLPLVEASKAQVYDSKALFKKGIEQLASNLFPGKHGKTKAEVLIDVMQSYMLFNGKSAQSLKNNAVAHIKNLFRPWKLVKAGDTSPVGAFKTSTIEALHGVIDENNEGISPSLKAVSKARKLLDEEACRIIGYECRRTQYGEVFYGF